MSERGMRRARDRQTASKLGRVKRLGTAGTATLGATVLFAPAANADTFTVNTTDDTLDQICNGADCSLRDALYDANFDSDGADTIVFASNVTGTITIDTTNYDQFYVQEEVTIQGPGADVLEISGDGGSRVFYVNVNNGDPEPYDPVTISGLSVTDGYGGGSASGGGLYSSYTTLTLTDMVFADNDGDQGGAIWSDDGKLFIANSLFSGNEASGAGGALYADDTEGSSADDVELQISNTVFTGNSAGGGGALYISNPNGDVVIENTTVTENETVTSHGGGAYISEVLDGGDLTIRNSTFSYNEGEYGGGLLIGDVEGNSLIENTTISGNVATERGGGLYSWSPTDSDQVDTIRNSTIVNNTAGEGLGGGVYLDADSRANISSSIIANNTAETGPDLTQADGSDGFEIGFSLIEDTTDATIAENPAGSNIFGQDPGLSPLAANGGPTQTHLPSATSPVIDAGVANGLGTDQRGEPRTFDAAVVDNAAGSDGTDIGSVELQPGEGGLLGNAECKGVTVPKIAGTSGDDTLTGTNDRELITGKGGDDTIRALGGKDCANGNSGNDTVRGGAESDQVKGGGGRDKVKGGGDGDRVKGQAGKDRVSGGGGDDKATGGAGKDRVKGGKGVDKIKGQGGKDRLKAADGTSDRVNCGGGKDRATVDPNDRVSRNCEKVIEVG